MKLLKVMYFVNVALLIVETITIYLYNNSPLWLCVMLLACIIQLAGVCFAIKKKI